MEFGPALDGYSDAVKVRTIGQILLRLAERFLQADDDSLSEVDDDWDEDA